ncbi:hypothetical protein [Ideonella sp. A 288]|uniref:hypothetical protein n=1 Tax=Ideonella sp. A 288 TaxID=1962181 RepID=UPI000B4B0C5D|nr:hypothetical protein [Ideonella sp. A 288]
MDVYVVIGNPNTRKSSLVRSLTGCFNRSLRDIQPVGGKAALRLYARVGCLQDTRTTPEAFLAEVQATRCTAALCCLAPNARSTEASPYPDAPAYLAEFKAAGWRVKAIAVLGQNGGSVRSPVLRQFPLATTTPINLTAHAVRAHFGWE